MKLLKLTYTIIAVIIVAITLSFVQSKYANANLQPQLITVGNDTARLDHEFFEECPFLDFIGYRMTDEVTCTYTEILY